MSKFLKSPAVSMIVGGLSFLLSIMVFVQMGLKQETELSASNQPEVPLWSPQTTEIEMIVQELRRERELLAEQKREMQRTSEQLKTERAELDAASSRIAELQAQFDQKVVQIKTDEVASLKKQARIYGNMAPEAAAQVLQEMDERAVVKLLASMKEEESATILESMVRQGPGNAKKAALLGDQLRRVLQERTEAK